MKYPLRFTYVYLNSRYCTFDYSETLFFKLKTLRSFTYSCFLFTSLRKAWISFFNTMFSLCLFSFSPTCRLFMTFTLPPPNLVIWTDGYDLVFLFGKGGYGVVFANRILCGAEVAFYFLAGPVCSSFSAEFCPFCGLFVDLGSTINTGTFFLFSDSGFVITATSFINCFFYLTLSGLSG